MAPQPPRPPVPTTSVRLLLPSLSCPSSLLGPESGRPPAGAMPFLSPRTWGSEPLLSLDHQPSQERLSTLGQDPGCSPPPASTSRNFHCPFTPSRSFAQNFILKSVFLILHTPSELPVFTHGSALLSSASRGRATVPAGERGGVGGAEWMLDFSFNKLVISYRPASLGPLCRSLTQDPSGPYPSALRSQLHSSVRNWLERSKFPFFLIIGTGTKVSGPVGTK